MARLTMWWVTLTQPVVVSVMNIYDFNYRVVHKYTYMFYYYRVILNVLCVRRGLFYHKWQVLIFLCYSFESSTPLT